MMGLMRDLGGGHELVAAHFFAAPVPTSPYPNKARNQQATLERYRAQGFMLHVCRTQIISSVFVERGVEAALSVKMLTDAYADKFDAVLLISRREDFQPLVAAVRALGKKVNVAQFHYATAPQNPLEAVADSLATITPDQIIKHRISGPLPIL